MNCRQARGYLMGYLDSELEASVVLEVNRHLEACPSCRERFAAEERLEALVVERLRQAGEDEEAVFGEGLDRVMGRSRRRWRWWGVAGAAVVVVWFLMPDAMPDLVYSAALDHGKYRSGDMQPGLVTSVAEEAREYLETRLEVSVGELPESGGWHIRGPRLCWFDEVEVGLVMLERNGQPVSLFVLSETDAERFGEVLISTEPQSFRVKPGLAVLVSPGNGTVRCAVGDIPVSGTIPAQVDVQVVRPIRAELSQQASRPGTVIPYEQFDLEARVSGYLVEIPVDDGSEVKRGDLLARLAVPGLDAEMAKAAARLAEAEAAIGDAQAELIVAQAGVKKAEAEAQVCDADVALLEVILRRKQALLEGRGATREEVDEAEGMLAMGRARGVAALAAAETARAEVQAATLRVVSAEARRDSMAAEVAGIRARIDFATLTCPFETAVVTRRHLDSGALVKEGESVILSLARLDRVRVEISVPERDAFHVRPGTPVDIQLGEAPIQVIETNIARTTRSLSSSRVMTVQVDLDNQAGVFMPGMFVYATLLLREQGAMLTLPAAAVHTDPGGGAHVFVVADGVARSRVIEIGADNGLRFAVISGLADTDLVIVAGDVREGSAVRFTPPGDKR